MSDTEAAFHQDMLNIYDKSAEIGYRPSYFLRMVNEHGGVKAAHRLLASDTSTKGFQRLLELERLDLTAEALILKPEYASLFSEEERQKARKRLADLGYTAPWDRNEAELEDTAPDETTDETTTTDTLAAWQEKIAADERIAGLVAAYPQWLHDSFGEQVEFRPLANQRFLVRSGDRLIQRGRFNQFDGLYIWFPSLPDHWLEELQHGLSRPSSLKQSQRSGEDGHRFIVYTNDDYHLLQKITERVTNQTMTMADAAYTILRKANGGPIHVSKILDQALQQNLIKQPKGKTPKLSLVSILQRDGRFNNQGKNMWELAAPLDANTENKTQENSPLAYTPHIYAGSDVSFWRFYFDPRWWEDAHSYGAIGLTYKQGIAVERIKQIQVGDRVVVWEGGSKIRGVGIVTHPCIDIRETSEHPFPANLFNGEYPWVIGVRWSAEITTPVHIPGEELRKLAPETHNRIKEHQQTITLITRQDYRTLLSLLGIDDIHESSPDGSIGLLDLETYRTFVQQLEERNYTARELLALAREHIAELDPNTDAADFAILLCQLRLVTGKDSSGSYRVQPYAYTTDAAEAQALSRLMALAYLHPTSSEAENYTLPARLIVPRLRTAEPRQSCESETFAPELGAYAPQLLAWYAEADLVHVEDTEWHPLPGALDELPGDGPATSMYNRFLRTLLAELDGTHTSDLPAITLTTPLPRITNLAERLRELAQHLLIDEQIITRICRSLLAGRHVVLSGPPGTGKTELAKQLPTILWREAKQTFIRLATGINQQPVTDEPVQRHGYAVEVVTATEEWSVRDVVGGIGPRLDSDGAGSTLSYAIQHGHLTRTLLNHFASTNEGRKLPTTTYGFQRQDVSRQEAKERYRGVWLVIDEFTRAPIDAAFGSLLTTLSGGEHATLPVPTGSGSERHVPLPQDFRIIGTLNSFDRHFLNQMSEAMKRRFDFIDVMPPHPRYETYEQGIAVRQALQRLHTNGLATLTQVDDDHERWVEGGLSVAAVTDENGMLRYVWQSDDQDVRATLQAFWHIFRAIRVFRQVGTAQAVAVYLNLFSGRVLAMSWQDALDTALADTLTDQLQVLTRDEQQVLNAYIAHADDAQAFTTNITNILHELPGGRCEDFLAILRKADVQRNGTSDIPSHRDAQPTVTQLERVFALGTPLQIPPMGAFRHRLHDLFLERGL